MRGFSSFVLSTFDSIATRFSYIATIIYHSFDLLSNIERLKNFCYNSFDATHSREGINSKREEVLVMATILTSLVVGVVSGIIGNYIYDKFIK